MRSVATVAAAFGVAGAIAGCRRVLRLRTAWRLHALAQRARASGQKFVLVTGATGWIGTLLVEELVRRRHIVVSLARRACGVAGVAASVQADLATGAGLELLAGVADKASTPCAHVFCRACIVDALALHGECPLCRQPCTVAQLQ